MVAVIIDRFFSFSFLYREWQVSSIVMAACTSLDELLEGISPGKLGRPCTDIHLCEIALRVTNWKLIAPFLDLSQAEIEAIAMNERIVETQRSAMLRKWREKSGRKATYRRLAKVFYKQQRADLVDEICNLFLDDGSSSSDESVTTSDQEMQSSSGQSASRLQGKFMHGHRYS